MKKIFFSLFCSFLVLSAFAQSKYSATGGIETAYKNKYTFTARLDEKTSKLIVETNAPVTVITLETYTPEELAVRIGKEYTNTYTKSGNKYIYDLKKPLLKDKYAYWVKVSIGNNGVPLGEYFFQKLTVAAEEVAANGEEVKNAAGATVINTNIKCAAGKTKVINVLKAMEGVSDVKIDIATGKLTIKYSSDGTPYTTILSTINENGFDANGQKTTNAAANPCIKHTGTTNNEEKKNAAGATIITTNIKCAAGKTKVINTLKAMDGVFDVQIDIATGKLTIKYSSDGTPYTTILSTINENGFDANGQTSTNMTANPCNKKTTN